MSAFLFQRLSVAIQEFNAILLRNSFERLHFLTNFFLALGIGDALGTKKK